LVPGRFILARVAALRSPEPEHPLVSPSTSAGRDQRNRRWRRHTLSFGNSAEASVAARRVFT
jgi:hypothetical protein